jgi:hypothetical protein
MLSHYSQYIAQLMEFYHQKNRERILSPNMQQPTPARLKRECLTIFGLRRSKTDLEILRHFFEFQQDEAAYERAIRKIDIDKFRPLRNFLKGAVDKPDEKTINLLAWLVDFYPRPYRYDSEIELNDNDSEKQNEEYQTPEENANEKSEIEVLEDEEKVTLRGSGGESQPLPKPGVKYKQQGLIALAVVIIGSLGLSSNRVVNSINKVFAPQCMYWLDDHFIGIDCDQRIPNVEIIALDPLKIKHFKRITRRDTLTSKDINKVWYASVGGEIEFYTTGGYDPRLPGRQLRPMSKYIYEKYILDKAAHSK